jgi:hypothetical protein
MLLLVKLKLKLDGASVLYTSSKNDINVQMFYEYVLHRFYNFTFR